MDTIKRHELFDFLITPHPFAVRDEFMTALAAGSVDSTAFEPTGQAYTRTVNDTAPADVTIGDGSITMIGNGNLSQNRYMGDSDLATDYPRAVGLAYSFGIRILQTDGMVCCGLRDSGTDYWGLQFATTARLAVMDGTITRLNNTLTCGAYGIGDYVYTVVLRAAGAWHFIKGGPYIKQTLLYPGLLGSNNAFPFAEAYGSAAQINLSHWRLARDSIVITPLASDSFDRASIGSTDGAGHPEANGGGGLAWETIAGTWGITSNKARALTVDGGSNAVLAVDVGKADVIIEAKLETNGNYVGFSTRIVDANNYYSIRILVTTPTVRIFKMLAGTPTQVATIAFTYAAGARMVARIDGNQIQVMYNEAVLLTHTITDSVFDGVTKHGLYTAQVGSVVNADNLVIWGID